MSTVGNVTLQGNVTGAPTGSRTFGPISIPLASAVDATQVLSLSSGNTTITVPTGSTLCVILGPNAVNPQPNPLNSQTLTVKGVAGDTGIAVSAKYPTMISWDTAPASFVINSTGSAAVELWFA